MPDEVFTPPIQKVSLTHLPVEGLILDVGGGGEGIVARLEGRYVCSVDSNLGKIREARIHEEDANWFNCDGRELCFKDDTFTISTLWFSLGYLRTWDMKHEVLGEIYRVLKSNGLLSIWACKIDCEEPGALFRVDMTYPNGSISRYGFGVAGNQNQTPATVTELLKQEGFLVEKLNEQKHLFHIICKKAG